MPPQITKEMLDAKIEEAARLQREVDKLKPINDKLKALKDEIHYGMQQLGTRRGDPVAGFYGLRSITKTLRIEDPHALAAWLEENVMDPRVYYTDPIPAQIDPKGITKLYEETKQGGDGELLPGVVEVETESFTLKRAK